MQHQVTEAAKYYTISTITLTPSGGIIPFIGVYCQTTVSKKS